MNDRDLIMSGHAAAHTAAAAAAAADRAAMTGLSSLRRHQSIVTLPAIVLN